MLFEGFHIKYITDPASGNTKGMFVSGIMIDTTNIVKCIVKPKYPGADFTVPNDQVVQIHVTDSGNHVVAKATPPPPKLAAAGKAIDDAVVAFVNARVEEGPLGMAFLQSLYAFLNTGHGYRMSTIRSSLAESLKKAAKQQG